MNVVCMSRNSTDILLSNKLTAGQVYGIDVCQPVGKVAWPRGYKTFPSSTQLSTKFILLINDKMPTFFGI